MIDETTGDIKVPPITMGQGMCVLADVVAGYISGLQPQGFAETEAELKTYHQVSIGMFLYQLLMRSKHKEQMAGILDAISVELRAAASEATENL
jgi:hypothetical protein